MQTYFIYIKKQPGTSSSSSGDMSFSERLARTSANVADFGMSLSDRLMNSSLDHTTATSAMSSSARVNSSFTKTYDDEYGPVVEV